MAMLDTYTITIPSVANTSVSVSYKSGGESQVATAAGNITVDAGTSLTATWTAASGYRITAGASQTIAPVASAQTLTSPTVAAVSVTVDTPTVTYNAGYGSATVTATVDEGGVSGVTYSLKINDAVVSNDVAAVDGTVRFSGVDTSELSIGSAAFTVVANYTGAEAGSGSTTETKGDTEGWFSTSSAGTAGGAWTNTMVTWTENLMVIDEGNNAFKAIEAAKGGIVTITLTNNFLSINNESAEMPGQAAIRIGGEDESPTFQLRCADGSGTAVWTNVTTDTELDAEYLDSDFHIVFTFDYSASPATFSAKVGGSSLRDSDGVSTFRIVGSEPSPIARVDFAGNGKVRAISGVYVSDGIVIDSDTSNTVVVASNWVAEKLSGMTAAEAKTVLAADYSGEVRAFNGYNYYTCYTLGLATDKADDKPVLTETSVYGSTVTFDVGNVTPPEGVTLTVSLESSTTPGGEATTVTGAGTMTIVGGGDTTGAVTLDITEMGGSTVKYYRLKISVSATN